MKPRWPAIYLVLLLGLPHAQSQVVINEIFYHSPNDLNDLQWIELHNTTDQAVSLTGWRLTKGTKCTFGAGASVPGGGYVVVCKDKKVFQEFYEVTPVAEFEKPLKHNTEKL